MKYSIPSLPLAALAISAALLSFSVSPAQADLTGISLDEPGALSSQPTLPGVTQPRTVPANLLCNINNDQTRVRYRGFVNYQQVFLYEQAIEDDGFGIDKAIARARLFCHDIAVTVFCTWYPPYGPYRVGTVTAEGNLLPEPFVHNCE